MNKIFSHSNSGRGMEDSSLDRRGAMDEGINNGSMDGEEEEGDVR